MAKVEKKPRPLAPLGVVRRRPKLSRSAWETAGRPNWCIRVWEQWSVRRAGWTYYRVRVPVCDELRLPIRIPAWGAKVETGYFRDGTPAFYETVPWPALLVGPGRADPEKGHYQDESAFLLWDRSITTSSAQTYQTET